MNKPMRNKRHETEYKGEGREYSVHYLPTMRKS